MSAALAHPIGPNTIEDWLAMDPPADGSRIELIWGYFHVSPAPMGQHQVAVFQLSMLLNDALRRAGRTGLHVVPGVAVEISTPLRTGLIPDVVVLDTRPVGASFRAKNVLMAVEVWSGGNVRSERESKIAAYAAAGVTYFWALSQEELGGVSVTAYRLENGQYVEELTARPGETATIKAAPEPVTFDPAVLSP
ncbi:Uma2 family endonuclease [Kutzneria sp. CA-103260]|uniref:Uma2 family endonuclease n=1 Tax=Kutzneria sp. CA-103260 TaxID=2802641 RepID=UPI001BAD5357|nr:Uma2 family endonuclease [Kutzneria sp. CA-103260]